MNGTTRTVKVGNVLIGGGHPTIVQSMWKEAIGQIDTALTARVDALGRLGCGILRFAVPDMDAAERLGELAAVSSLPLVADIHFDWKIALRCLDFPIAKIRINPGNIGARWKVAELAGKASDKGVAIRIGVNGGSMPKDLEDRADRPAALVEAAEREVAAFDELGFTALIVSMKASDVDETIRANRLFASRHDIPLHLGVTEAGPAIPGIVRSTAALYTLLKEGIGDTIRVSLSDSEENETIAGSEIVALADGGRKNPSIISCPKCGRAGFDTHAFLSRWQGRIYALGKPVTIAVMGCVVNGPGEARHADLGIAGGGGKAIIFRKGAIPRTVPLEDADSEFGEELSRL
ncbi:MAG: flavodoxin-dependent (E)-4-hydroxy-3-methylbut-2-enyl-diphosphate synthase [Spirochaetes bacterium]|nr:flavodoxin-dependent (E)-4-hydroxy-3-methylbut-2-enyl-diphosphate synthase [Spirochaetota bacterium]